MSKRRPAALVPFVVMSLFATAFIVAGVFGLFLPEQAPALARPAVAWSLIAAGVVIDAGAAAMFVIAQRRPRP
ncbi:MAG: hypothetical protein ACU85V_09575 [Gammaproteobacteria bacterium]